MRRVIAGALALTAWGIAGGARAQSIPEGELVAQPARLATQSLLLDIAYAGTRLVAVGERGHVLLSDDAGTTWQQAKTVPTQALLTAVCFLDDKRGIAVGHDEVIIVTADSGVTWQRTHYAPEAQQPLLDVWCSKDNRAIAVGAYSAYYVSTDAGASWRARKFESEPLQPGSAPEEDELDEFSADYHLNHIVSASETRFYLAAEAGHLYRSDDGANTWRELPSPYEGSFFGVLPLTEKSVLAFGLRGNLYRSDDEGLTWRSIETGTVAMLNDAMRLADGRIAIVGLSGVVLVGGDNDTFELRQQADRKGLSAVVEAAGALVVAGEGGIKRISLSASEQP